MKQLFYLYPQQGIAMIDSIPEPQITLPDDVKIKIEYAAICGSDAHMLTGQMIIYLKCMACQKEHLFH